MAKENHWCAICGIGYEQCDHCQGVKSYTPWRTIVDTENHYRIFMIVKEYSDKYITKEKAKSQLKNVDLSGWENFKPTVVEVIKEILADDSSTEEVKVETKTIKSKK